jgi:polar amino acid transport system substrate-binding protein
MEFFDDEGNPIGFDIDMGREIAARLGLRLEVVNSVFDSIISAVNGGKCDIILSSMNITADRKKQIDFITYFQAGQAFVVAKDNPENIHTQEDLCGKSVAAETGTTEVDYLQGTGDYDGKGLSAACEAAGQEPIDVQTFQKDSDALLALQGGQVSAYFADSPVAGYYVQQHPESFELSGLSLDVIKQGIGVPKEKPDLQAQVRRALSSMVRDGTYLSLLEQWGLQDGTVFS